MHMTPARFRYLLDAHGADFSRWPETERDAGRQFAAASPEAIRALHAAARFDQALDTAKPAVSADVVARVLAAVERLPPPAPADAAPRSAAVSGRLRWASAAALACAVLLGIAAGLHDRSVAAASGAMLADAFSANPTGGLGL